MNYPHPLIAREGWPFLGASVLAALLVWAMWGFWWALPIWLVVVFVAQFFRDPPRALPMAANAIVSPADGRIVAVGKARDPYLNRDALKVSVFMNVFNVHSNRSPFDGEVQNLWYHPGNFLNAALDKASEENERNAIWIKTQAGEDIVCVQVAGLIARRILCYVGKGDRLQRGQRYGFIRFGSRVDLYLPLNARVRAAIGDKVRATSDTLAEFNG
jgi:phosphatidylserine decarboxylase